MVSVGENPKIAAERLDWNPLAGGFFTILKAGNTNSVIYEGVRQHQGCNQSRSGRAKTRALLYAISSVRHVEAR